MKKKANLDMISYCVKQERGSVFCSESGIGSNRFCISHTHLHIIKSPL